MITFHILLKLLQMSEPHHTCTFKIFLYKNCGARTKADLVGESKVSGPIIDWLRFFYDGDYFFTFARPFYNAKNEYS